MTAGTIRRPIVPVGRRNFGHGFVILPCAFLSLLTLVSFPAPFRLCRKNIGQSKPKHMTFNHAIAFAKPPREGTHDCPAIVPAGASKFSKGIPARRPARKTSMTALISMVKPPTESAKLSPSDGAVRADDAKAGPESTYSLVLRARGGDRAALDELCVRYTPRLRRWAHGRLPSWSRQMIDTEDLVQETLTRVTARIDKFEPRHEGAFQGYVRQALHRRIVDEVNRATGKVAESVGSARPSPDPSPLEQAIGTELLERYEAALLRVKPEDRDAIIARVEMDLTWAEVAEALDKNSSESAQMTVKRALVRLAREMSHGSRA
jgi:RNA polymerase sigma-70 factor, ECF subfamily